MKTTKFKALSILMGSMLISSQKMSAGVIDSVKKFASDQVTNFNMQGLLVIGGIVAAGLLIYIISNHVVKDKNVEIDPRQRSQIAKHNHERYQQRHYPNRHIVKKTA